MKLFLILNMVILALLNRSAGTAFAGEAHEVNLSEIVERAEKMDHSISASQFQEVAADQSIHVARSQYLPTVDLEAIDSTGFSGSTSALGIGGVMGSPYRSGPAAGLLLKQTIWDFGRTSANVEAAKHELLSQKQNTRLTIYQVDREVAKAYFDCVRFRVQSEVWTAVLKEANLVAKEVKHFVRTGQRSVVEQYLADSQVEEALTAQTDFSEKMRLVTQRLALFTGLDPKIISCPNLETAKNSLKFRPTDISQNPLIVRSIEQAHVAQAKLSSARAAYLPKLFGLASVGTMDKTRLVAKQDYALGVGLTIPIFDGLKTTSEVRRAEADSTGSEFLVQASREQVDHLNIKFDEIIDSAKGRLVHLSRELSLANEGLSVAKKRYLSLQGTLVDVRESLRNLTRTQTQMNDTEIDFLEAGTAKAFFNGTKVTESER